MGAQLPKPVTTKILERYGNNYFTCGVASMNGYRERMEDAHAATFGDNYGFFAIFDGHMDPSCSAYMGKHFPELIRNAKPPIADDILSELTVNLDQQFLATNTESGSTGTYFVATLLDSSGGEPCFDVQVGNVGDSRVIVGRDGKAIPMTTDHKPTLEEERQRIEACGGVVVNARVDGNLAVSRAFGDGQYKGGEGGPLRQKVIALPEIRHIKCTSGDFIVLSCDGVFEGNFNNDEVIEFVAKQLETNSDLASIAAAVCDEALDRGSKDNITCMLVQFHNGLNRCTPHQEFLPGPYSAPNHNGFRTAFAAMAQHAGLTLGKALELRYDYLQKQVATRLDLLSLPTDGSVPAFNKMSESDLRGILSANKEPHLGLDVVELIFRCTQLHADGKSMIPADIQSMKNELASYNEGPPASRSGEERTEWFSDLVNRMAEPSGSDDGESSGANKILVDANAFARLQALQQQTGGNISLPVLLGLLQASGADDADTDDA